MNYSTDGYAPTVPADIDVMNADTHTLILMVRDTLQNGANPARGNIALARLVESMELPVPDLPLDPEPYAWDDPEDHRSKWPEAHDSVYGYVHFAPRFGFAQEREKYIGQ